MQLEVEGQFQALPPYENEVLEQTKPATSDGKVELDPAKVEAALASVWWDDRVHQGDDGRYGKKWPAELGAISSGSDNHLP